MDAKMLDQKKDAAPKVLDGPRWAVNLQMEFDETEATTPSAAVSQFLVSILYRDLREMAFTVHDRHSEKGHAAVLVKGGQVRSTAELTTSGPSNREAAEDVDAEMVW